MGSEMCIRDRVSLTSVPFNSASLLNLIPTVDFIIDHIMYEIINTKIFIETIPNNCDPKEVSGFVSGTASVPQIPANKWAGIAPTTSSIFNENKILVPITTTIPPNAPIKIAVCGEGINGSAVIATNPPIHPFNICITSVFPNPNLVTIAAAITPPAPAKNVFKNIVDTAIASSAVPIAN